MTGWISFHKVLFGYLNWSLSSQQLFILLPLAVGDLLILLGENRKGSVESAASFHVTARTGLREGSIFEQAAENLRVVCLAEGQAGRVLGNPRVRFLVQRGPLGSGWCHLYCGAESVPGSLVSMAACCKTSDTCRTRGECSFHSGSNKDVLFVSSSFSRRSSSWPCVHEPSPSTSPGDEVAGVHHRVWLMTVFRRGKHQRLTVLLCRFEQQRVVVGLWSFVKDSK